MSRVPGSVPRKLAIVTLALVLVMADARAERRRAARHSEHMPIPAAGSRLVWVGAHPDDEVLVAPVLGDFCVDRGLNCSILVLTRGERGECLRAEGCKPDLATVRIEEMRRAAELYGAELEIWDFADGTPGGAQAAREVWAESAGGDVNLVLRLNTYLERVKPDLLLTFDPRHGTTCHTDHQATGWLVLDALAASSGTKSLYLLETGVRISPNGDSAAFFPALENGTLYFDASRWLPAVGSTGWDFLVRNAQLHRSQFPAELVENLRSIPVSDRLLYFLPFMDLDQLSPGLFCATGGELGMPPGH